MTGWRGRDAGAEKDGRRGVRTQRRRVRPDPAGGRGRKMAELRALVAVKRVIDFAVKVTGPPLPSPCAPRPYASGVTSAPCLGGSSRNL